MFLVEEMAATGLRFESGIALNHRNSAIIYSVV
jgi:hypothetical protein